MFPCPIERARTSETVYTPSDSCYTKLEYICRVVDLRILGIDPGYAILGYGVVDTEGSKHTVADYGVIETAAGVPFPARLDKLYCGMQQLIALHKPEQAVFEELFFTATPQQQSPSVQAAVLCCLPRSRRVSHFMSIRRCRSSSRSRAMVMRTSTPCSKW